MGTHHPLDTEKIDRIWIDAAADLGFLVRRSHASYASTDGAGVIEIGSVETLDDDDSLAQLVFHELCHAMVQGEENLNRRDWGMDNTTDEDVDREYACLRVQAHLADRARLRSLMAPTTVVRDHYIALPEDALAGEDVAAHLARTATAGSLFDRWQDRLGQALLKTARVLQNPTHATHVDSGNNADATAPGPTRDAVTGHG